MSESATHDAIEAVARDSYGRLVAYIASRTGDIADAQDALSEALVAALETWPRNGVPDKPEAWPLHVARNRLIDASRREQTRRDAEPLLLQLAGEAESSSPEFAWDVAKAVRLVELVTVGAEVDLCVSGGVSVFSVCVRTQSPVSA